MLVHRIALSIGACLQTSRARKIIWRATAPSFFAAVDAGFAR